MSKFHLSTQPNHERWANESWEPGPPLLGCEYPELHPSEMRARIRELEDKLKRLEESEREPISAPNRPYWGAP
jgi:hypothetical protein